MGIEIHRRLLEWIQKGGNLARYTQTNTTILIFSRSGMPRLRLSTKLLLACWVIVINCSNGKENDKWGYFRKKEMNVSVGSSSLVAILSLSRQMPEAWILASNVGCELRRTLFF